MSVLTLRNAATDIAGPCRVLDALFWWRHQLYVLAPVHQQQQQQQMPHEQQQPSISAEQQQLPEQQPDQDELMEEEGVHGSPSGSSGGDHSSYHQWQGGSQSNLELPELGQPQVGPNYK